ncbi:MAG: bacteriocin family protein [Myxococcales bacterium]|nr:bacteriocin family protein [Myxococcales bacterium]MCB9737421.1 bacteriocin family protein [Deltaproteobacteria bacterium]
MNDLHRELAPISERAWERIESEARDALKVYYAARKLVGFSGPHGWEKASIATGEVRGLDDVGEGVIGNLRVVQPMVELRVPFTLDRRELDTIARGNPKPDLDPLTDAAKKLALAEDRLAFHGNKAAGVVGMVKGTGLAPVSLHEDYLKYPGSVVTALQQLREAGVGGPYGIALGPRCFKGLMTTVTEGGYPVYKHVRDLVEGPIVHAPAVDGAVVLTMEEGAFELVVGRDASIGYLSHDSETVSLYFEESLTFRLYEPDGAVWLKY